MTQGTIAMFDLGWVELSFLAILALIVVGPKDLPKLARGTGKLWGRVQRLYRQSLQSIHKLETEIELASGPDGRRGPSYYDLLPEHVRRAMETAEPSRDAEQNQKVEAMYNEAMADLKKQHEGSEENNSEVSTGRVKESVQGPAQGPAKESNAHRSEHSARREGL